MNNELQIFNNPEFGTIRAMEIGGEPWFVGKDVATALGYSNTKDALASHVDAEDKRIFQRSENATFEVPNRGMTIINESGLYSLTFSSKLPTAKKFTRWVTSEVLPSIRKTGGYIAGQETMSDAELLAKAVVVAQRTIEEREKRIAALESQNAIMQPKADYFDALVDTKLNLSLTDTAKELHMKRKSLIHYLEENKFLYRRGKKLLPYEAKNDGYFELKEAYVWRGGRRYSYLQTTVTPRGRELLRVLCKNPMEMKAI